MTHTRLAEQLLRACTRWGQEATAVLDVDRIVSQAAALVREPGGQRKPDLDSAVIVTKAPHAGSESSVIAIVARCLAFGVHVQRVVRMESDQAESIARALYPDVWLNFVRMPVGQRAWDRLAEVFDCDDYETIFGCRYSPTAVVTGYQAVQDNRLSETELMEIWQTGREPLPRDAAAQHYGQAAADLISPDTATAAYFWYRGRFPIGIHRIGSSLMAFAMRHPRLYGGRPIVLLNGQFSLLPQRFRGSGDAGAVVIELGLTDATTIPDLRRRLIGDSDDPRECRPGSIRRDAYDGDFETDAPETVVTAWANAVHASDGYLAGAIEASALLGAESGREFRQRLESLGYSSTEIDLLIMKDPVIAADGDEQRLTKRTAMDDRERCLETIQRFFPPLERFAFSGTARFPLSALLDRRPTDRSATAINRPAPELVSRFPLAPPSAVSDAASAALVAAGETLIGRNGLAIMTPCAGSGGRFGGYHVPEGDLARLKPLLGLFDVAGRQVSAMDVRTAHVRALGRRFGVVPPMLVSCSHQTEPHLRRWARGAADDLDLTTARVPVMYRLRVDQTGPNSALPAATSADQILRDLDGSPLLKPVGSLGMLIAAACSGTLRSWAEGGVQVAVTANSDDVGFRVDPAILGLFVQRPALDAVVLTVRRSGAVRGGLLRERSVGEGWSAYIEEHAEASGSGFDQFNTNQIYVRVSSVRRALGGDGPDEVYEACRRLPLYFEQKQVNVGGVQVPTLHGYQTCADILRLLPTVLALRLSPHPEPGQCGGYAALKSAADVPGAQEILTALVAAGDRLELPPIGQSAGAVGP
ncbi:UTP--glucose-1-phosphate uridylyltransferase [Actinoplanes sp. NPDC026623]|uniref:UTP--glucose-1-phosphate uridylyltransferase n=1 Tax=Actinoplanes sp. NPDC026623 TaxID=3155610 RepID=UPI0033C24DB8